MTSSSQQPVVSLPLPTVGRAKPPADLPAPAADGTRALLDRYGRQARDLRVSLTDRCNLRCTYCMPAEGLEWMPTEQTLSDEETIRLIRIGVGKLGIRQVRFTGGEPLLRKSLEKIIAATKELRTDQGRAPSTALTTNGLGLKSAPAPSPRPGSTASISRSTPSTASATPRLPAATGSTTCCRPSPPRMPRACTPSRSTRWSCPGSTKKTSFRWRTMLSTTAPSSASSSRCRSGPASSGAARTWSRPKISSPDCAPTFPWRRHANHAVPPRRLVGGQCSGWHARHAGHHCLGHPPFCGDCDRTRLTDGAIRNCLFGNSETRCGTCCAPARAMQRSWRLGPGNVDQKPGHGIDDEGFLQPDVRCPPLAANLSLMSTPAASPRTSMPSSRWLPPHRPSPRPSTPPSAAASSPPTPPRASLCRPMPIRRWMASSSMPRIFPPRTMDPSVAGDVPAGAAPIDVPVGHAVRIMTGAPWPIPQECSSFPWRTPPPRPAR